MPDGTIYVAGARRTRVNPDRWDLEVSVLGPDKTAYGPFVFSDPEDKKLNDRSERGRAVVVLNNGNVVVVGEREAIVPTPTIHRPYRRRSPLGHHGVTE